ncbi:MAG: DNA translocase FtsK 4TM domain-containing protein, partial [Candidatus Omnitrophica bacterium]|nr:DNA translocase FtsK 4TM domain-containing protein [Candidatus Omnitrophota bacterium]
MRERRLNEVKGVILVAAGLMVLASLVRFDRLDLVFYTSHPNFPPKNLLGIFGAHLANVIVFLFGAISSFVIPALVIMLGIKYFRQDKPYLSIPRLLGMFVLLVSLSSLIGMFNLSNGPLRFHTAGFLGALTSNFITTYFSRLGGFIVFITFIILSLALVTEILISSLFQKTFERSKSIFSGIFNFSGRQRSTQVRVKQPQAARFNGSLKKEDQAAAKPKIFMPESNQARPKIQIKNRPQGHGLASDSQSHKPQSELKIGDYHLPSVDLLDQPPEPDTKQMKEDLEASARILEDTLEDFGIEAKVTDIIRGPVITRYELEP